MKFSLLFVVGHCSSIAFFHAQPLQDNMSNTDAAFKGAITARTFIPTPLEVPAFVPPAPPVEKTVPAMRVDSAVTVPAAHSRTLTILRGEASTLPDIP